MRILKWTLAVSLLGTLPGCVTSDLARIADFITAIGAVSLIQQWLATL